ncbi:GATA zinc finger domain-containing protein 24-like [Trichoplusia ni]|uniref:GATA zinc finger domain-containing protein 24-like n=1 Tax=Trichoplusia ni TaxID=7111 RepID=A0A7E5X2Y1_TRINI|nr:GATA zinc finger domain-containing protein 24-like [Trichoplusia ni]
MEVSNEIKEDIRKTQSDLKNAIRIHQIWVARLQDDENNNHIKTKVKEAEKEIIAIGQTQKLVVERLRRELELYQQRLKARNKQINIENDNRYVAQQLRDHQLQYRSRNRTVSLLKPSVLNEIHIKTENNSDEVKENISDSEIEIKLSNEKENSNHSGNEDKDQYSRNFTQLNNVHDSRSNFVNALNKVKEAFSDSKHEENNEWQEQKSDSDSSRGAVLSPTPSPPPLPEPGEPVSKETFLRLIGLVTPLQREIIEKKRNERRKRSTTSTNRNEFLYGSFEMLPKKKKYNQFPYLQTHNDPPQTRSAKLRKQQNQNKTSREGSPSGSSTEIKEIC